MRISQNFSLRTKTAVLALIPFAVYLVLAGERVRENMLRVSDSNTLSRNVVLVKTASALIHQVQRERGKSVAFLNGSMSQADLDSQRKNTDLQEISFSAALSQGELNPIMRKQLAEKLQSLIDLRSKIDSHSVKATESTKVYTSVISDLLSVELAAIQVRDVRGVAKRVISLYSVETGKESTGRLRAIVTSVLSLDAPISLVDLSAIVGLNSVIEQSIMSPALDISAKSRGALNEFMTSPSWQGVQETLAAVTKNWATGHYERNPKVFFELVTKSIDSLGEVVAFEADSINEKITEEKQLAIRSLWILSTTLFLVSMAMVALLYFVTRSITSPINQAIVKLDESSERVSQASSELQATSQQMSSGVTQSSASLQETSSSLEEISAMITKNSENAVRALEIAQQSQESASNGKGSSEQMTLAIQKIQSSNDKIMQSVRRSTDKFSEVAGLITEIGEKTKVINEIVFQTKLLSFNASVEAARAGEHGKGFAVVAEEVGNLARMSQNAAQEISDMLETSVQKVKTIVQDTQSEIGGSMDESKLSIEKGVTTTQSCALVMTELFDKVGTVNVVVNEIATACREQATGVKEINLALQQLNQVTQETSASSEHAAEAATQLAQQSEFLQSIVNALAHTVAGGSQRSVHALKDQEPESISSEPSDRNIGIAA